MLRANQPDSAGEGAETETGEGDGLDRRDLADPDFRRRLADQLPFLRRLCRRWERDHASAEDLVHDTVLRALANAHLWQPGTNLRAWLSVVMRNCFLAGAARANRATSIAELSSRPAHAGGADLQLLLRDIERALRRLPPMQRAAIRATGIDGKSYEEAAEEFGVSVAALRCHLARGRERLRAIVDAGESRPVFAGLPARVSAGAPSRRLAIPPAGRARGPSKEIAAMPRGFGD